MISIFLVSVAALSVLLFGSVEAWAFAIVGACTLAAFNLWVYREDRIPVRPVSRWQKALCFSVAGLISLFIFQILPLPASLLKLLSFRSYELMKEIHAEPFSIGSISFYRYSTLNGVIRLVIYLMLFLMAVSLTGKGELMKRTLASFVIFGFLLSFFAIIQKATWNGKIYWFRELTQGGSPFGPFVNRNHFAGLIGMIIPLGLGLSLEEKKMEKKLILIFLSLIMALGIFYSLSRGGIISFLFSMVFFIALVITRRHYRRYIHYLIIFLSGVICYLLYLGISPIVERFAQSGLSSEGRMLVWKATLKAFADFAWFGTGLGTFRYVFPLYYPEGLQSNFLYAHNDYLQFLLETGVVGASLLALASLSLAGIAFKACSKESPSFIMAGLATSMIYMLVHSFFDFNLHIPSNAIMFSVILGLLYGLGLKSPVSFAGIDKGPDRPEREKR
jgi:O-antigen ligase